MGDVNLEIKLNNIDERVIKIEESGGGSGGDGYITSVSNDFNVVNKKLSLSNDVTTKLSKVDTPDNLSVELAKKINKPASATDGQVLTYNGTSNEWEAKNPNSSITEPTDLEKGIIGGDEWVSGGSYTIGESVVIDENKLYLLVGDGGSTTKPSTDTTHSIWEETSISALNSKLNSSLGNVKFGKLLWQGSFSSGSITVPNLSDYTYFVFKSGNSYNASGTASLGIGGYRDWASDNLVHVYYRFNVSGDTLTIDSNNRGMREGSRNIAVTEIYGVF